MMEPRMDVGMDPAGCRSLDEALASGAAPEVPTAAQAVEILDGLLVRLVTAQRGAPGGLRAPLAARIFPARVAAVRCGVC